MNNMDEFIEALREGKGYDWIANHGWELSKDELVNIIKEYDYAIHEETMTVGEEMQMYNVVANNLELIYGEEC